MVLPWVGGIGTRNRRQFPSAQVCRPTMLRGPGRTRGVRTCLSRSRLKPLVEDLYVLFQIARAYPKGFVVLLRGRLNRHEEVGVQCADGADGLAQETDERHYVRLQFGDLPREIGPAFHALLRRTDQSLIERRSAGFLEDGDSKRATPVIDLIASVVANAFR